MINSVTIENYKSIPKLELNLGRLNVLIGENGCGKTNILEAMALASAAAEDRLDNDSLVSKGIRLTEHDLMVSRFEEEYKKNIVLSLKKQEQSFDYMLTKETEYSGYIRLFIPDSNEFKILAEAMSDLSFEEVVVFLAEVMISQGNGLPSRGKVKSLADKVLKPFESLKSFKIYCPENTALRDFHNDNYNLDPSIHGQGLFRLLTVMAKETPDEFLKIRETLRLLDWYEDFDIPTDLAFTERRIKIKDRYLAEDIAYFDQRSANEGFLYMLFYITIFISKYTPKFFAIDNLDTALNPKMCEKLMTVLARLAKEHDKQCIITSHNPSILDGLNLNDEEQCLFVVSRNKKGHTKAIRIQEKPAIKDVEPLKLSEQFLRGYIGGLPKNF